MKRAIRYVPCVLLLAASIAWGKHSITPTIERLSLTKERITQHEKLLAEWSWVATEPTSGTTQDDKGDRLTVEAIAAKVAASRVSLARLAEAADGTTQFETRSDFAGLIQFLDRVSTSPCQFLGVRKHTPDGLRASFRTVIN